MKNLLACLCFFSCLSVAAADVPDDLDFAGIRLKIKSEARRKIAEDVEKLTKVSKSGQAKIERIQLYFPIIERILAEEGLPNDFKYLVVQESSLVSDAVSSSNAVGFWQFKRETALEMGLAVNSDVDERKHIVASTRAAARYLKRNNFFFNNWVYALLAYNTGVGGAKNLIDARERGSTRMDIDGGTHWYVLKYLAHRIAFENIASSGPYRATLSLLEYPGGAGRKLSDIAGDLKVDEEQLAQYNKWLNSRRVPDDREYTVLVPVFTDQQTVVAAKIDLPEKKPLAFSYEYNYDIEADARQSAKYPVLKKQEGGLYEINNRPGIQAKPGDDAAGLAGRGAISLGKFLAYNDLSGSEPLTAGKVYYLKKKRGKAKLHFHTATEGETLWQISQKYGIRLKALKDKNRIADDEKPVHGRILWLRFRRPANKPVEIRNLPAPKTAPKPDPAAQKTAPPPAIPVAKPIATPDTLAAAKSVIASRKTIPNSEFRIQDLQDSIPGKPQTPIAVALPPAKSEPETSVPVTNNPVGSQPETEEFIFLKTHQVQAGETLFSIARQYGVSVAALRQWNGLAENGGLRLGQKLVVSGETENKVPENSISPKPQTPPATAGGHIVQPGETLYSIAKRYRRTVAELRQLNGLAVTDSVKTGQKLVVNAETLKNSIPGNGQTTSEYEVKPGDTLYKIAKAHGVTVAQLLEWNGKPTTSVSVGEKLKVGK